MHTIKRHRYTSCKLVATMNEHIIAMLLVTHTSMGLFILEIYKGCMRMVIWQMHYNLVT